MMETERRIAAKHDRRHLHHRLRHRRRLRRRHEGRGACRWPRTRCWWTSPTTSPATTSPPAPSRWPRRRRCSRRARCTWRWSIPGWAGDRADIVVEAGGAFFVGPDNGLLALAARGPRVAHRIERPDFRRDPVSPTFHGRDVFAQTAGQLARGSPPARRRPAAAGHRGAGRRSPSATGPTGEQDAAVIVHIDAFGNLITSLAGGLPGPGSRWRWILLRTADRRSFALQAARTYADVAPGRAAGLRGQRRAGRDRRARGLGRRRPPACAGAIACGLERRSP